MPSRWFALHTPAASSRPGSLTGRAEDSSYSGASVRLWVVCLRCIAALRSWVRTGVFPYLCDIGRRMAGDESPFLKFRLHKVTASPLSEPHVAGPSSTAGHPKTLELPANRRHGSEGSVQATVECVVPLESRAIVSRTASSARKNGEPVGPGSPKLSRVTLGDPGELSRRRVARLGGSHRVSPDCRPR